MASAPGVVLSSGNVSDYNDGPNTTPTYGTPATAAQEALLDPITSSSVDYDHFDVTQLYLTFTTSTCEAFFNVVLGSEEYPEFVGSEFIDAFGLYLDGTNIAFVGGNPVNINHPDMAAIPGTELDGILASGGNPLLTFSATGLDTTTNHTLTFIVGDTSDDELDTTVYLASLGGTLPQPLPEPVTLSLFGLGLLGLAFRRRKAV